MPHTEPHRQPLAHTFRLITAAQTTTLVVHATTEADAYKLAARYSLGAIVEHISTANPHR